MGIFCARSRTASASSRVGGGAGMSQLKLTTPSPACSMLSTIDGASMSASTTPIWRSGSSGSGHLKVRANSLSSWTRPSDSMFSGSVSTATGLRYARAAGHTVGTPARATTSTVESTMTQVTILGCSVEKRTIRAL
jgi:hypothetical protein